LQIPAGPERRALSSRAPPRLRARAMKLTAVAVLKWNGEQEPLLFGLASDLSTFGFFQRGSVREMLTFVSRTVAKRTQPGTRQTVQHEEYYCHAHNRDGLVRRPTPCQPPGPLLAARRTLLTAAPALLCKGRPPGPLLAAKRTLLTDAPALLCSAKGRAVGAAHPARARERAVLPARSWQPGARC